MSESEQQLLLSLKTIVEGLLSSQVSNVWNIYGGLNRLHRILEKILKHEFTVFKENGEEDIWVFVERAAAKTNCMRGDNSSLTQERRETCPLTTKSSDPCFLKSVTGDPNHPTDPAMKWLRGCIERHKLSSALSELLEDEEQIACCYSARAFLRQHTYAQACLTCLSALELNQLSLLTDIHPSLYLSNRINTVGSNKIHRRCSSYPEKITKELYKRISDGAIQSNVTLPPLPSKPVKETVTSGHKRTRSLIGMEEASTLHKSLPCLKKLDRSGESSVVSRSLPNKLIVPLDVEKPVRRSGPRSWSSLPCLTLAPGEPPPEPPPPPSPPLSPSLLKIDYRPIGKPQRRNSFSRNLVVKPSLLENGTEALAPVITGFFPRPCVGQSLTSFLTSHQFSFTRAELDRENAHFRVSEAIIGAIEQVKWNKWEKLVEESVEESDEEICELKQRIRLRRKQKLLERNCNRTNIYNNCRGESMSPESSSSCRWTSDSLPSTSTSDDDGVEDMELDQVTPSNLTDMKLAGVTLSMGSLYSEADLFRRPIPKCVNNDCHKEDLNSSDNKLRVQKPNEKKEELTQNETSKHKKSERKHVAERSPVSMNPLEEPVVTAEGVALSLLRRFSDKQLPRASDIDWLVSEKDAPQQLLPLPESWSVEEESVPTTALRGTNQWAPPRPQIIFTIHPTTSRRTIMVNQKYMCGGCGMKVAPEYAHRFRYCDYLGKYFCTGCHTNQQAIIPARVLFKWDFSTYPVSNFSFKLLEQMSRDPLFNVEDINKVLFKKVSALDKVRVYRQQLYFLKDFLLSCRFANGLHERLEKEESYLFREPLIYSIDLLVQIRTGKLVGKLATLLKDSLNHVNKCQLCLPRGFVCEHCHSAEVIYPWQISKVCRCQHCGTCFHLSCHNSSSPSPCPRCVRISARTAT